MKNDFHQNVCDVMASFNAPDIAAACPYSFEIPRTIGNGHLPVAGATIEYTNLLKFLIITCLSEQKG